MGEKSFLITGANFSNKGAQSMLFTAISELRRRYPGCRLYVLPLDSYKGYAKYSFNNIQVLRNIPDIHLFGKGPVMDAFLLLKDLARRVLGREPVREGLYAYRDCLERVDCILDISGFCLSSQFPLDYNCQLLESIEDARRYRVPIILMPQSFGPFAYEKKHTALLRRIREDLRYPAAIFAREKGGYELLKEMGLTNVFYSTDMVLQSSGSEQGEIFLEKPEIRIPEIPEGHNVAVIPNAMNLTQCDKKVVLGLYRRIVRSLVDLGKTVYVLYHSNQDRKLSEEICMNYREDDRVCFLNQEFMCYEYDEIVRRMDFIVASRYHSIVHGYRNAVPSVILGWAEKYRSLADLFGQGEFIFDVRENISDESLLAAIEKMSLNYSEYKVAIGTKLEEIQKESCFHVLDRTVK